MDGWFELLYFKVPDRHQLPHAQLANKPDKTSRGSHLGDNIVGGELRVRLAIFPKSNPSAHHTLIFLFYQ